MYRLYVVFFFFWFDDNKLLASVYQMLFSLSDFNYSFFNIDTLV